MTGAARDWRPLAFCICAYAVASVMLSVIPILVNLVAERYDLDESEKGLFSSTEFLAMGLASLLSPLWIRRWPLRTLGMLLSVALATLYWACVLAASYDTLVILRFGAGFVSGALMSSAAEMIGRSDRPDNNFGWVLVVSVAIAFAMSALTPRAVLAFGSFAAYLPVAILVTMLVPLAVRLPRRPVAGRSETLSRFAPRDSWGRVALAALWFEAAAASVLVTYLGSIGLSGGLTQVDIGDAIAAASIVGFGGSLIPALFGVRFGRSRTIIMLMLLFALAFVLLPVGVGKTQFSMGVTVFWVAAAAIVPYYMSTIAMLDPRSILVPILPGVKMIGFTAGPFVASFFVTEKGLNSVHVIGLICLIVSTMLILLAIRKGLGRSEACRLG